MARIGKLQSLAGEVAENIEEIDELLDSTQKNHLKVLLNTIRDSSSIGDPVTMRYLLANEVLRKVGTVAFEEYLRYRIVQLESLIDSLQKYEKWITPKHRLLFEIAEKRILSRQKLLESGKLDQLIRLFIDMEFIGERANIYIRDQETSWKEINKSFQAYATSAREFNQDITSLEKPYEKLVEATFSLDCPECERIRAVSSAIYQTHKKLSKSYEASKK
jgi:hypothetical protein